MNIVQRLARTTIALLAAMTSAALIWTLFGADFTVSNEWHPHEFTAQTIAVIIFGVQMVYKIGFVMDVKWKVYIAPVLIYVIIHRILVVVFAPFVYTFAEIATILFVFALASFKGKLKRNALLAVLWYAFYAFFALSMNFIRNGRLVLQTELDFSTALVIGVELIVYSIAMYFIGGKHESKRETTTEHDPAIQVSVFPLDPSIARAGTESAKFREVCFWLIHGIKSGAWRTEEYWVYAISVLYQWLVMAAIIALCAFANTLWVGVWIVISHSAYSAIIKKQWHSNSVWRCTGLTAATMFALARILPDTGLNFFLTPLAGLLVTYISYRIECYAETARDNAAFRIKHDLSKSFRLVKGCNYDQMREIALLKGLDETQIDLLDRKYCQGIDIKSIHIFYELNHPKRPAYRTVQDWIKKAESEFNKPL